MRYPYVTFSLIRGRGQITHSGPAYGPREPYDKEVLPFRAKMPNMVGANTSVYLDAIAHLPPGGTLILNAAVTWEEYESVVENLGDHTSVRVTYDSGWLEATRPTLQHSRIAATVSLLAYTISDELGCTLESLGSATFKMPLLAKGIEPDCCFYVQNARRIIGMEDISLEKDPPPDVMVEVDISHDSSAKMPIYASMKVPEVWRYDGRGGQMHIYELTVTGYAEITNSHAFPMLTAATLSEYVAKAKAKGQTAALRSLRDWIRRGNEERPRLKPVL